MIAFDVQDMTCGHCVSMITKAVKQTDRDAQVTVDLSSKRVQIESVAADEAELRAAIQEAGYTAVKAAAAQAPVSRKAGGSCCGSCH